MPIKSLANTLKAFIDWARGIFEDAQDVATGGISNTVQAILDIREMDCGGDWTLYVKTAIPAIGASLYLLLTPSPQEIFESYLEPKMGRGGGRRGRRDERKTGINKAGQRRLFFGGGIPDIDNQVADMLPGRGFFKGRSIGPGEYLFWTGINVADRVLWYWLLLEATETFATTWQSGLLESGQCIKEGPAYARVGTLPIPGSNNTPLWFSANDQPLAISSNCTIGNNGNIFLPGESTVGKGFTIVSVTYELENTHPTEPATVIIGFRIFAIGPGGVSTLLLEKGETVLIPPASTTSGSAEGFATFALARIWQFTYRKVQVAGGGNAFSTATASVQVSCEAIANV